MFTVFVLFIIAFILLPTVILMGKLVWESLREGAYLFAWIGTGIIGFLLYLIIFNPLVTN